MDVFTFVTTEYSTRSRSYKNSVKSPRLRPSFVFLFLNKGL